MTTAKKIISIFLAMLMIFSTMIIAASAKDDTVNYLVLGDSIAFGFGVENRTESCYGRIVADTNGYNYRNLGRTAWTSEDLIDDLNGTASFINGVEWADIISISIGGNDFLLDNVVGLILSGLLFKNFSRYDTIGDQYYINLSTIIARIHEINPDAVILVQTLYNTWTTFAGDLFQQVADRVNSGVERCAAEEENVYVVDTTEAFYHNPSLITTDTIHPNAEGNVVLAALTLEKLYELGLGTETVPQVNVEGISRDYFNEYFGPVLGPVIIFLADYVTGVRFH